MSASSARSDTPTSVVVAPRTQNLVLATLCLGMFMAMLDNVVVANALPRIDQDLGAGITGLQWVIEGYSLVFAALLLTGGTLGDRLGRRGFYLGGLALFVLGSVISALAPDLGVLIAGRAVQGVGAAALIPQSLAILRVTYPEADQQAKAFALWSAVSALGLALGPAIGGPMVDAVGWPSVFWINVPIGLGTLWLGLRVIPRPPGRPGGFDPVGQAAAAAGLAATVAALIESPVRGWTDPLILILWAVAVAAFAVFALSQMRAPEPAFDHTLLKDRLVRAAILTGFAVTFAMFGTVTFLGIFMQDILGWSPTGAGLAALPVTLLIVVMAPLATRLTLTYGARRPLVIGMASCVAALLWLSVFGADASYLQYCWALPLLGIGLGLCYTPVTIVIMMRVPVERAGNASAATNISRELGGVAGVAVMGAIITAGTRSSLEDKLAALNPDVLQRITDAVLGGGAGGIAPSAATPGWIRTAVESSFVDGLHVALWAAAGFLTACALLIHRLARPTNEG